MSKKIVFILLIALLPLFSAAAKEIGPTVSEYRNEKLKWEDGAFGYHVMFKSLISNTVADADPNRPEGDTCKDSATYSLSVSHIPSDALIERAFLVWTAAQPVAKRDQTTDDKVTFSFSSNDGRIMETREIAGKKAYKISEAGNVSFEFDAFQDKDEPNKNWYTYRVDVTDFFKTIQTKGRENAAEGSAVNDGYSLLGDYTLTGLECTNESVYTSLGEMVADWSVILIYSSVEISPKKIYIYDGFEPYWHTITEINVTGFEFPVDPEIRVTLASHEGDQGIALVTPPDGLPLYEEGIQVQGENPDTPNEWILLWNKCNPKTWLDDQYIHLDYTEIFNSISSVYGYNESEPECIGGEPPVLDYESIEYGIDVDTFVMDTLADNQFARHFKKGDGKISFKIGANQDQVITNYMIVSVDTKSPQFDIPGQPEKVACTPANKFDPYSLDGSWCQNNLEHTFALRIQNWGTDAAENITISDKIPAGMEYVPGSTEYATSFKVENGKKIATRWIPIPDDGGFPLEKGFNLSAQLQPCAENSDYIACSDLAMVRFRAKVKSDTPKNQIIENTATYRAKGLNDYRTNLGIPVKLRMLSAGCVTSQDAVDLSECGGVGAAACTKNEECGEGYICDKESGSCIEDPSIIQCKDSNITVNFGKNSPSSETIFVGNPQTNLVIGQLEFAGTGENCYLNLNNIMLKVSLNDTNIEISNIKMYKDNNGDGLVDAKDTLLSSADTLDSANYVILSASNPENRLQNNRKNNILISLDAKYKEGTAVGDNAYFSPMIEKNGITLADGGTPQLNGLPLNFSKFQFEPDNGFIVTKGPHDPAVPAKSDMNKFQDVLQLRVIAKGASDTIKKMTIKTPSKSATLGEGIKKLAVYEDTDNDGKGDREIASATSFDKLQKHQFTLNFDVPQDTEKYLTIKAEPALGENETFQVIVSEITLDNLKVYGTPVDSKTYTYSCDPNLEDCGGDDDGCSIVVAEDTDNTVFFALAAAAMLLLSALALRMRKN